MTKKQDKDEPRPYDTPEAYLEAVACGTEKPNSLRVQAAKALVSKRAPRRSNYASKKDEKRERAEELASDRFQSGKPPKLSVIGR